MVVFAERLGLEELFRLYEECSVPCPSRLAQLRPYRERMVANWRQALRLGDELVWFTHHAEGESRAATGAWRHTGRGWMGHGLASRGGPAAVRAVLRAAREHTSWARAAGQQLAQQLWCRVDEEEAGRLPRAGATGSSWRTTAVNRLAYCAVPRDAGTLELAAPWRIERLAGPSEGLARLAACTRGLPYVSGEELTDDDLLLEALDERYRRAGLRRYRRVWLAWRADEPTPAAALVAYRGPLGLSFSFLENRLDLLARPGLELLESAMVASNLLARAAPAYADFEPGRLMVAAQPADVPTLQALGGKVVRRYQQCVRLTEPAGEPV